MGRIALWRVVWGVALLTGLAWRSAPEARPAPKADGCSTPVVWVDGGARTLLCDAGELRSMLGGCRLPGPISAGSQLVVSRGSGGCVIGQRALSGATRLRMGLRLDINRDSARTLAAVAGIGPATAEKIVGHRPYGDLDELTRVRGIGVKRLAAMRPFLTVRPPKQVWPPRRTFGQLDASTPRSPEGSPSGSGR